MNHELGKRRGVVVVLASLLIFYSLFFIPYSVHAQGLVPCGPKNAKEAGNISGCTVNDFFQLGVNIYNFLLGLAAVIAVLIIIFAGLGMLTYHWFENPDQVLQGAKYTFTRAITGLIIVAIAYLLVNTLVAVIFGVDTAGGVGSILKTWGILK